MLQTKTVANPPHKTIGEKIVAVLRQPLFTIPFPKPVQAGHTTEKKPKPMVVEQKRTVKQNKNGLVSINRPRKYVASHNAIQDRKTAFDVFTPERNKEEFEKIQFILRACNKMGGKAFANVLHVEKTKNGSRLIATDGHRMHVAEIGTRIKPGDYKPVVTKNAIRLGKPVLNVSFPNWERAVPEDAVRRGCINPDNAVTGANNRGCGLLTKLTGEKMNPDYLADLTKKPWVVYSQKEKRKALLLKEYGAKRETYAVIMPLAA